MGKKKEITEPTCIAILGHLKDYKDDIFWAVILKDFSAFLLLELQSVAATFFIMDPCCVSMCVLRKPDL